MRFALVGGGFIGHRHADAIERLGKPAELVVVIGRSGGSAQALASSLGVDASSSLGEVLARGDIDAVVICTPSGLHADAAVAALDAGKHVLVEKPLDVSVEKATRVVDAARRNGRAAAVVSQHRFDPASRAVHDALRRGRLGRPTSCVMSMPWWRDQAYYDSAEWRGTALLDGGALLNQAVHTVDLMTWFLGVPDEVFAWTALLAHERIEVEDTAVAVARFPSGALGVLHATTAAYPEAGVRIQVHGDQGSAVIENDRLVSLITADGGAHRGRVGAWAPTPVDALVAQYEDFLSAAGQGRAPLVDAVAGTQTVAVIEAMYASAASGRPFPVPRVAGAPSSNADTHPEPT
jgi:UDP-N-acetyl-2-amino-2-deoxyglucuronate dehydrogenase